MTVPEVTFTTQEVGGKHKVEASYTTRSGRRVIRTLGCKWGIKIAQDHLHHVIPKVTGGTDKPGNLISIDADTHAVFHRVLQIFVKDSAILSELSALGGKGVSQWEQKLLNNPVAVAASRAVLLKAADVIDKQCKSVPPNTLREAVVKAFADGTNLKPWAQ